MPVTLSQFTNSEIDVRYKEEFLSGSMNTKVGGGIIPTGIHSGFYLTTSGVALSVTVDPSSDTQNIAMTPSGDFVVTLRRTGSQAVDLSSKVSTTVAICLYANYAIGGTTAGEIRAYETSPTDELTVAPEFDDLVILGEVVVPASGVIAGSSITANRRTPAAEFVLPGQKPLTSLVQNPAFTFGDLGSAYSLNTPPWEWQATSPTDTRLRCSNSNVSPVAGTDRYQAVEVLSASTPASLSLYQDLSYPIVLGGSSTKGEQFIRVRALIGVNAAAAGGTAQITVQTMDNNGNSTFDAMTLSVDLSSPGLLSINEVVEVASSAEVYLSRIGIDFVGVSWGTTGEQVDIYYLQAQIVDYEYTGITDKDLKDFRIFQTIMGGRMALFDRNELDGTSFTSTPSVTPAVLLQLLSRGTANSNPLLKLLRLDRTDEDNTNGGVSLEMRGHIEHLHEADVNNGLRDTPAIQSVFAAADSYTLFWESQSSLGPGVSHPSLRLYSSHSGEMWFTSNAYFEPTGALWHKDTGAESTAFVITNTEGVKVLKETSVVLSTTWLSTAWDEYAVAADPSAVMRLGEGLQGAIADALLPRVSGVTAGVGVSDRTLMFEFEDPNPPNNRVRVYHAPNGLVPAIGGEPIEITENAEYLATGQWQKDIATNPSGIWSFARSGMGIGYHPSTADGGTNPFNDGDWDETIRMDQGISSSPIGGFTHAAVLARDGRLQLFSPTTEDQGSNPLNNSPVAPVANTLYAKTMVKAMGRFTVTNGGAPVIDQDASFNISSITNLGLLGMDVVLRAPVETDSHYVVVITGGLITSVAANTLPVYQVSDGAGGPPGDNFIIVGADANNLANPFNFGSANYSDRVMFIMLGKQT